MRFSIISALTLAGAGIASAGSAIPMKRGNSTDATVQSVASAVGGNKAQDTPSNPDCIAPLLCCTSLATPLDHIVDPILKLLGVDGEKVVGSLGLLCMSLMITLTHGNKLICS